MKKHKLLLKRLKGLLDYKESKDYKSCEIELGAHDYELKIGKCHYSYVLGLNCELKDIASEHGFVTIKDYKDLINNTFELGVKYDYTRDDIYGWTFEDLQNIKIVWDGYAQYILTMPKERHKSETTIMQ